MALEITELLKTKLVMLCCNEINFPSSESRMIQYIKKLDELQEFLKSAEGDEANDPIFEGQKKKFEEWQKLLRNIYFLEDSVESLLFTNTLKFQKLLIVQPRLNYKIWQLGSKVRKFLGTANSVAVQDQPNDPSTEPGGATEVPPSSEGQEQVMETDSSLTNDPEILQPSPTLRQTSLVTQRKLSGISLAPNSEEGQAVEKDFPLTIDPEDLRGSPTLTRTSSLAPHQPMKLLSRKWSNRPFALEDDDEIIEIWADTHDNLEEKPQTVVLQDLANKLALPLFNPATSQYLIVKADISSSGKAILLWTVYNAETVKQYFQSRAWIHVSQVPEEKDILKAILEQATDDKETKGETLQSLQQSETKEEETLQSLRQRLRDFLVPRRWLIVLYGDRAGLLWNNNLKGAFPKSLSGSRVIIATPHADGSKSSGKSLDERPLQNLAESTVYLEDSSINIAKAVIDDLTESILNPHKLLFLISIVGVVDSGEKTLLWPMYNAEDVKLHFQCRAWVHVPERFKEEDLLNNILKQVKGDETETNLDAKSLQQMLRNFLAKKRYLLVLYDVWRARIWEFIRLSFPNTLNGSRVILVVPDIDVARRTDSWILNITPKNGFFPHFKGMQDNAPDARNAKRWDTFSDIMDKASGIVGLADEAKEQAQLALNSYNLHWLIPVLGVAGSGKTTLVKAFYNSVAARQHFDCRAWINVPQDFDERDILLDLFGQVRKAKERQSLSLDQLRKGLGLFLAWRRYLIVLDDVRKPEIWKRLQLVLPNSSNGSKVMVTMRKTYEAYHMNGSSVFLRPLKKKESWELFSNRVATGTGDIPEKLKEKILESCRGLPLSIVVLGGLLSNKEQSEWFKLIEETNKKGGKKKEITGRDQPNSGQSRMRKHETDNVAMATQPIVVKKSSIEDQSTSAIHLASPKPKQKAEQKEAMNKKQERELVVIETSTSGEDQTDVQSNMQAGIVKMSYEELSFSTRCCLLYLGLFPKGTKIPIRRLFKLWLAEGLLTPSIGEKETDENMAKSCLKTLKEKEFIEIGDEKLDGSPKTCSATNTFYDYLFPHGKKFGFFHIHNNSESDTSSSLQLTIRRLAAHLEINPPEICIQHLRSYISFCKKKGDAPTSGVNELLNCVATGGLPMLVVLDLEGVYKPLLSEMLGKLPKLKYLGLRRTLLDSIPESVGDLPNLETLDVKDTYITTLPGTIWKGRKLQHLYMSESYADLSSRKPSRGSLNYLQTLWGLKIRREIPGNNWLNQLLGLRKLKLTFHKASISFIASWIPKLKHLESLKLRLVSDLNQPAQLNLGAMQELKSLKRLYLLGELNAMDLGNLPENLEILTLSVSNLSEDPMKMLEELKNLKVLRLYARSYMGPEMTCHRGKFHHLQVLKLWMLENLQNWTVEKEAMQNLKNLEIRCCKNLKEVVGLENLTNLKEVMLTNMKPPLAEAVKQNIGSQKVFTQDLAFAAPWV